MTDELGSARERPSTLDARHHRGQRVATMDQLSATLDRGWDLAQRGDAQGALACGRRALEIDPQSPEVHNLLGYSAALAGEAEDALEHYRQAIALDESYFEAMLNCAELLMHPLGDWDEASQMCDEALDYAETNEEIADCLLLKVDALLGKGTSEEAKKVLVRIPDGPFESPTYAFMIGRAHYELGDVDAARPFIEDAATRDPHYADAHYYLGLVREEAGDVRGAIEAFLRVRLLDQGRPAPPWAPSPDLFGGAVKRVIQNVDALLARYVREAEVYVVDLPGAELVVDGIDPRALVVLETPPAEGRPGHESAEPGSVYARLFVYQRNVERAAGSSEYLEDELRHAIEREISHVFLEPPLQGATPTTDKSQLN
jgi:tetratricopeptide (TPR) repeat protein